MPTDKLIMRLNRVSKKIPLFRQDIDNLEEDELSDEDFAMQVKMDKCEELVHRADLVMDLTAIQQIISGVQHASGKVMNESVVKAIQIERLKTKQDQLRSIMDLQIVDYSNDLQLNQERRNHVEQPYLFKHFGSRLSTFVPWQ